MIYSAKQTEEHHNKKRDVTVFRNTVTSLEPYPISYERLFYGADTAEC